MSIKINFRGYYLFCIAWMENRGDLLWQRWKWLFPHGISIFRLLFFLFIYRGVNPSSYVYVYKITVNEIQPHSNENKKYTFFAFLCVRFTLKFSEENSKQFNWKSSKEFINIHCTSSGSFAKYNEFSLEGNLSNVTLNFGKNKLDTPLPWKNGGKIFLKQTRSNKNIHSKIEKFKLN